MSGPYAIEIRTATTADRDAINAVVSAAVMTWPLPVRDHLAPW